MRSTIAAIAFAAAALIQAATAQSGCDAAYECKYHEQTDDKLWAWDFTNLCKSVDYVYNVPQPTSQDKLRYVFNICGYANQRCVPDYEAYPYNYGNVIQMWGDQPQPCQMYPGCSPACETLGNGMPHYAPFADPTQGINITFAPIPSDVQDTNHCPYDDNLQGYEPRKFVFQMICDKSVAKGSINIIGVVENPTCTYTMTVRTANACGAIYAGPDSGTTTGTITTLSGGGAFGFIILGAVLSLGVWVGIHYYRHRELPFSIPGMGSRGSAAAAAPKAAAGFGASSGASFTGSSGGYSTVA